MKIWTLISVWMLVVTVWENSRRSVIMKLQNHFTFICFIFLYNQNVFTLWMTLVHFGLLSCRVQEFSCLQLTRHALMVCFMLDNWLLPMPRQQTVLSRWRTVTLFGLASNTQEHKSRYADKCCSLPVCVRNPSWIIRRWRCNFLTKDVRFLLTLLSSCAYRILSALVRYLWYRYCSLMLRVLGRESYLLLCCSGYKIVNTWDRIITYGVAMWLISLICDNSVTTQQCHNTTVSQHNTVTTQHCHNTTVSQHNSVTTQHCHNTTVSQHNSYNTRVSQHNTVTTQHCHNTTLSQHKVSQHNTVTTQQCHNTKCAVFQEKLLKCYNFLWVQQRHNCSPAASFANCVMTLYLLKVHMQKFLSIPIIQKCQILSCDNLVANERYLELQPC